MTAVITGLGVVAPSGLNAAEHWDTVVEGRSTLGRITRFDPTRYESTVGGEIAEFDIRDHVDGRLAVQTDRWTWMAFLAAQEALDASGLDVEHLDPYELAVVMASSSGGNEFGQGELQRLWRDRDRTVSAYQSIAWFYAATVGQLSIKHRARAQSSVLASEAAGGLDSVAHAARLVARGSQVVLAGGLEAPLSPYALACQQRSGWLSTESDPLRAYRPFDDGAAGYVPGEGGAVLVVENLEHARARDAPVIYGEIAGWASTHDGEPTRRGGGGSTRQYARAMSLALGHAGVHPDEVDMVVPDALGMPAYDHNEAAAIREVFGARRVPVTSSKALYGRLYQGGSAVDVVNALLTMRSGVAPGVAGLDRAAAGCRDLAFVESSGPLRAAMVLVTARGFDGFNSAILLRRYTPAGPSGEVSAA